MESSSSLSAMRTLDPRVVGLWRLQALVSLLTVLLPVLLVGGLLLASWVGPAALVLSGFALAVLGILQVAVWPPLAFRRFRFQVREDALWVGRGVLFRQQTIIPHARIQHVDTRQGPLERLFGLSRVMVYTASGPAPDTGIPGLDNQEARQLRDALARRGGTDDGL